MKLLLRITPMILVILGLFLMVGCEETDDEEVNPLVGTWAFSNLEQTSTYTASGDGLVPYGVVDGAALGSGTLNWAQFSAMGVNGTVSILEDGSFTLTGNFPIASDTLGVAPTITPLTDAGTWTENETAGTLAIDGAFYDLGGLMTWSDDEMGLSLAYAATTTDSVYVTLAPGLTVYAAVMDVTATTIGFTKQ